MKSVLFLLLISTTAFSSECEKYNINRLMLSKVSLIEKMPEAVIAHYQQTERKDVDIIGDFSLYRKAASTPKKIFWTLKQDMKKRINFSRMISAGKSCANELFEQIYNDQNNEVLNIPKSVREKDLMILEQSKLNDEDKSVITAKLQSYNIYLEGQKNPLKVNAIVDMISQIILEEKLNGISPSFGKPHEWSDEFKNSKSAKFSILAKFPKILLALARGETSQYLLTGTEKELENWIMTQEYNSITLDMMIRNSYIINQGDMYLTLLTIENVLNKYWRNSERANLPITVRLTSIINSFGSDGDKFGTWYHLFGMMIYGYAESSFAAKTVGSIETIGSNILSKFEEEKQESFINSKGGVIGGRLAKVIKNKNYENIGFDSARLNVENYLDLSEDFSKRLNK